MQPLVVLGNVNVDLILGPVAPWPQVGIEIFVPHDELRVGGSAGNTALAWAGLGVPFRLCASRGNDSFGDFLVEAFPSDSVSWTRSDAKTTLTIGITHPDGERTFLTTLGHLPLYGPDEALAALREVPLAGGWLLLSGAFQTEALMPGYGRLVDYAHRVGARVAIDPGWPPVGWTEPVRAFAQSLLAISDCALLSEVEATTLTGCTTPLAAAKVLARSMRDGAIAVVKCGPSGAVAAGKICGTWSVPAPKVDVVDTIGAGDVFNAGFLAAIARDAPIDTCLEDAVALASRAISTSPRSYAPAAESPPLRVAAAGR